MAATFSCAEREASKLSAKASGVTGVAGALRRRRMAQSAPPLCW